MSVCAFVDGNVSTWLPCFQETAFFGEALLMVFAGYLILALLLFKSRLPGYLALPMGVLYTMALYSMNPLPEVFVILVISLMLSFAWIALVILSRLKK